MATSVGGRVEPDILILHLDLNYVGEGVEADVPFLLLRLSLLALLHLDVSILEIGHSSPFCAFILFFV